MRKNQSALLILLSIAYLSPVPALAILIRGDNPWSQELRSFYDDALGHRLWFLNLGPTGIRARMVPETPDRIVVEHVFQDDMSPARGKIKKGDIIVGANGKSFKTSHRFGRRLRLNTGWDGPLFELAQHIEDSQGGDGVLTLMVQQDGDTAVNAVALQLEPVGRFADTFPFNCPRSEALLEELCDFIVRDYESSNWKAANKFYGQAHGEAHQLLALMASGISKYDPIIERERERFYDRTYSPEEGGFRMWRWGYESIVMGEMYHLYKDEKLVAPMKSLAEAMPWGSFNRNGIYTHRSFINIRARGGKPYASIATISGLQMVGMSIFRHLGLHYEEDLYETIYQHYLRSARPSHMGIAYTFSDSQESPLGRDARHAVITLKDPSQAKSGKGPGYVVPTGMEDITEYEIAWPTKSDHRWKPTDWVEKERDQNVVEELNGNARRVNRFLGDGVSLPDPTKPYETTTTVDHVGPSAIGGVAMLIGSPPRPGWRYLGHHAANTSTIRAGAAFDGHAASNIHGFWSVLASIRSNSPEMQRAYFDYMKTFLILAQTHDKNGLYLQPWGRDRANADVSFGPRILPTATGAMLLALPQRRLIITGADMGTSSAASTARRSTSTSMGRQQSNTSFSQTTSPSLASGPSDRPAWAAAPAWANATQTSTSQQQQRTARSLSADNLARLERALIRSLHELSTREALETVPMQLSISQNVVTLEHVEEDGTLTFTLVKDARTTIIPWTSLTSGDHAILAALVATIREQSSDAQAMAGVYLEYAGSLTQADVFMKKANPDSRQRLEQLFQ